MFLSLFVKPIVIITKHSVKNVNINTKNAKEDPSGNCLYNIHDDIATIMNTAVIRNRTI